MILSFLLNVLINLCLKTRNDWFALCNQVGDTALHLAVRQDNFDCAEALIQCSADLSIRNGVSIKISFMVPCHHTCHHASVCTLHLVLSVPLLMKKTTSSCARWKLKGFVHRSFSVQAPLVWSNLPPYIRHSSSLSQFKTFLKTFLFTSAFSELPWSLGRLLFLFVCFDRLLLSVLLVC